MTKSQKQRVFRLALNSIAQMRQQVIAEICFLWYWISLAAG